jgi:PIN domain nuclease of toxin-antitoxin system
MEAAERQGFELLPLAAPLAASFSQFPPDPQHRDPFDRMLVWQAMSLGLTLVSRDRKITQSQLGRLQVLW